MGLWPLLVRTQRAVRSNRSRTHERLRVLNRPGRQHPMSAAPRDRGVVGPLHSAFKLAFQPIAVFAEGPWTAKECPSEPGNHLRGHTEGRLAREFPHARKDAVTTDATQYL